MEIISKELLSEVLETEIRSIEIKDNYVLYKHIVDFVNYSFHQGDCPYDSQEVEDSINIHELAHKCKEWAYKEKRCSIDTHVMGVEIIDIDSGETLETIVNKERKMLFDPLMDIKGAEWILDNEN